MSYLVLKKDDMADAKGKIIQCLKDEGGAAGLDKCCAATGLSKSKCKARFTRVSRWETTPPSCSQPLALITFTSACLRKPLAYRRFLWTKSIPPSPPSRVH